MALEFDDSKTEDPDVLLETPSVKLDPAVDMELPIADEVSEDLLVEKSKLLDGVEKVEIG